MNSSVNTVAAASHDDASQPTSKPNSRLKSRLTKTICRAARSAAKKGDRRVEVVATITVGRAVQEQVPTTVNASRLLDPAQIDVSRWSNRHELSYLSMDFLKFKSSIVNTMGNQVPVLVRPKAATTDGGSAAPRYELVYGHRRLKACQEWGLPVRAQVEHLSDFEVVKRMQAENQQRASLSAYEAGLFYTNLIATGMFRSHRELASAFAIDHSDTSRKIWLASLPTDVLRLFRSPLEIGCGAIKRLQPLWARDPAVFVEVAQKLYEEAGPLPASKAVTALLECASVKIAVDAGTPEPINLPASDAAPGNRDLVEIELSDPDSTTFRVNWEMTPELCAELKFQLQRVIMGYPDLEALGRPNAAAVQ